MVLRGNLKYTIPNYETGRSLFAGVGQEDDEGDADEEARKRQGREPFGDERKTTTYVRKATFARKKQPL